MRKSFGVGLGAEPIFSVTPAPGRENQLAEAGVTIAAADSSRSVAKVIFFIALSCEFDPFRDHPPQGTARHHAEPHRRKRATKPNGCVRRTHDIEFTIAVQKERNRCWR